MSLRVNTNLSSLVVQNAMTSNQRSLDRAMKNIATGSRLSDPSADISGTAISDKMQSEIRGMNSAQRNTEDAISFTAIAEGGLSEQSNILMRMRELAIQSASDSYSNAERELMNREYTEIKSEFDRIAKSTRFNSVNLLDGSSSDMDFQVGTRGDENSRITFKSNANTTASGVDIDGTGVGDKSDAREAISTVDKAMSSIATQRSKFGAMQARFESAGANLNSQMENLSKARSQIADADIAKEISDLRRAQVLQQYQSSLLQQVNDQTVQVLRVIG